MRDAEKAVDIVLMQYRAGTVDFTRVTQLEQFLVQQQDVLTQARGEIATGLVQVYKALGGGWEIRLCNEALSPFPPETEEAGPTEKTDPATVESLPTPVAEPPAK